MPEKRKEGRSGGGRGGGGFVKRSPCPLSPSQLGISSREITEVVSLPLPPLFCSWSAQPLTAITPVSARVTSCVRQIPFGGIIREIKHKNKYKQRDRARGEGARSLRAQQ